jgi:hypothetical protein
VDEKARILSQTQLQLKDQLLQAQRELQVVYDNLEKERHENAELNKLYSNNMKCAEYYRQEHAKEAKKRKIETKVSDELALTIKEQRKEIEECRQKIMSMEKNMREDSVL